MAPEPSLEAHASGWPQGDVEDEEEEEEGALVISDLDRVSGVASGHGLARE